MFKVKSHSNTYILQQVFVESVFICPKQQYHVCKNIKLTITRQNQYFSREFVHSVETCLYNLKDSPTIHLITATVTINSIITVICNSKCFCDYYVMRQLCLSSDKMVCFVLR